MYILYKMIHVRYCKKCGKAYDMMTCPYCNEEEIKDRKNKLLEQTLKNG